jgi:hypothetical protein
MQNSTPSQSTNNDPETSLTDYSPDGVDLTLGRWMLSLTPAERLNVAEQSANEILPIRRLATNHQPLPSGVLQ